MTDQDRPLFLSVTIKPRRDRLAEAEARQSQSLRRNALTEAGCVFSTCCSRMTTRTPG
jgi:hypothetical protein